MSNRLAFEYGIPCACGKEMHVSAGQAGEIIHCSWCGHPTVIPPLSLLRERFSNEERQTRVVVESPPSRLRVLFWNFRALLLLIVLVTFFREVGVIDFFWCRSESGASYGTLPGILLGKNPGKVKSLEVYCIDREAEKSKALPIYTQTFADQGNALKVWVIDYYYAAPWSFHLPLFKFGTDRAYFHWESSLDKRGASCGRSEFIRDTQIFGFCSTRHLREDAFHQIIGQIVTQAQKEITEANARLGEQ